MDIGSRRLVHGRLKSTMSPSFMLSAMMASVVPGSKYCGMLKADDGSPPRPQCRGRGGVPSGRQRSSSYCLTRRRHMAPFSPGSATGAPTGSAPLVPMPLSAATVLSANATTERATAWIQHDFALLTEFDTFVMRHVDPIVADLSADASPPSPALPSPDVATWNCRVGGGMPCWPLAVFLVVFVVLVALAIHGTCFGCFAPRAKPNPSLHVVNGVTTVRDASADDRDDCVLHSLLAHWPPDVGLHSTPRAVTAEDCAAVRAEAHVSKTGVLDATGLGARVSSVATALRRPATRVLLSARPTSTRTCAEIDRVLTTWGCGLLLLDMSTPGHPVLRMRDPARAVTCALVLQVRARPVSHALPASRLEEKSSAHTLVLGRLRRAGTPRPLGAHCARRRLRAAQVGQRRARGAHGCQDHPARAQ
jgi:hypothetical protein